MKKLFKVVISLTLILSLWACGSKKEEEPVRETAAASAAADIVPTDISLTNDDAGEGIGLSANGLVMQEIGPVTMDLPADFKLVREDADGISYQGAAGDVVSVSPKLTPVDFTMDQINKDSFAGAAGKLLDNPTDLVCDTTMTLNDHPCVTCTFSGTKNGTDLTVSLVYYIIDSDYAIIGFIYPSDGSGSLAPNLEIITGSILPVYETGTAAAGLKAGLADLELAAIAAEGGGTTKSAHAGQENADWGYGQTQPLTDNEKDYVLSYDTNNWFDLDDNQKADVVGLIARWWDTEEGYIMEDFDAVQRDLDHQMETYNRNGINEKVFVAACDIYQRNVARYLHGSANQTGDSGYGQAQPLSVNEKDYVLSYDTNNWFDLDDNQKADVVALILRWWETEEGYVVEDYDGVLRDIDHQMETYTRNGINEGVFVTISEIYQRDLSNYF